MSDLLWPSRDRRPLPRAATAVLVTAVVSAAAWWAWLGWDDEYQTDPVTGRVSGPFEAWQVVACVLTLLVMALVGGAVWPPLLVALTMTVAFTLAWVLWAAPQDDSGLWLVGAVLVLVGTAVGSVLVALLGRAARRLVGPRRRTGPRA